MSDVLDNEVNEDDVTAVEPDVTESDDETTEGSEDSEETEVEIELIVETGTCVAGANSYVTLEEAVLYHTERNRTEWLALSDNEKKASLVKATQYIDSTYNWKGREYRPMNQDLQFPRVNLIYKGTDIKGIPLNLKKAVMEASFYALDTELFTVYGSEGGGAIKREKNKVKALAQVEGAVKKEDETETEFEYFKSSEQESEVISRFSALDRILAGLYFPKGKTSVNAVANWRY